MLPIHKIVWHEWTSPARSARVPEPSEAMEDMAQIRSYVKAYDWGGPTSALQLHHLREVSRLIRPGDTVLDLACGPGPLLLELAPLYPDCQFIGADLSRPMLGVLMEQAQSRGLNNVRVLCEDIRALPALGEGAVDVVITTSALHHLPDSKSLESTFGRIDSVLKPSGGFYVFDFGLLRSVNTRRILVREVAKTAPPITATDYDLSLQAAFPIEEVISLARRNIMRPFQATASSFVDFYYFLRTEERAPCPPKVQAHIESRWERCSWAIKAEHLMIRSLRRRL